MTEKKENGSDQVKETAVDYYAERPKGAPEKKQGEYTLEDYYNLPDDQRAELIDGVLYNMSSPTTYHQLVIAQIVYQFMKCVEGHEECEVFFSPLDVQLDMDNKTMVQPDIIVLCDRSKMTERCVYGAPDFVLEVLSPSTEKKDKIIKLHKYLNAGCREYWIVDPDEETVTVYDFERDLISIRHTFEETIPVGISEGRCKIDFKPVKEKLDQANS